MRQLAILTAVVLVAVPLVAAPEVANPDFSEASVRDADLPVGWLIPDGSGWTRVADAGQEAAAALVWRGGSGEAAQQTVQYLTPNAAHRVRATVQSDGALRPVVRVVDVVSDDVLATLTAEATEGWQELSAEFAPTAADVRLEIFPHPAAAEGLPCPAGEANVAQVTLQQTGAGPAMELPDLGENVALGRPYTMDPAPRYSLTLDPGDATQLTDGVYTEGYFWTQQSTVGWTGQGPKTVTIDLGADLPIRAITVGTAAGVADVRWPEGVLVFTSIDGETWHEVADLLSLHNQREPLPEYGVYAMRRIWADDLNTHGQFVTVIIEPGSSYAFADEIEVFRGDDALLAQALVGEGVADVAELIEARRVTRLIKEQFRRDLDAVGDDIRALPQGQRQPFEIRGQQLAEQIEAMEPIPMDGFLAILPMTELEADIFRLQAEVWRAQGKDEVRLWDIHRWDPLAPSQEPEGGSGAAAVEVTMMQNEHRADVFNITNASERDLRLRLTVTGLPGAPNAEWLAIHEVQHVGTRWFTSVAAALPVADRSGDAWQIDVPAGMTRQVWVAINRPQMDAGTYEGAIEVRSAAGFSADVPVRLTVYPLRFPDETTLNVGGWTYTNTESMYGVTRENRMAVIEHLHEHYVNAPWATSSSMPAGQFDDEGNMLEAPDTTNFDAWVALWPNSKMYLVYSSVGTSFGGAQMGTEVFNNKVGAWAEFWAGHMESLGLRPDQLGLLLVDEPHTQLQYETITAWARAITAAAPDLVIWEDPQPVNPDPWVEEMFAEADVLAPLRAQYITKPDWFRDMLAERQAEGAELWFYSANGPARTFDPFSYYLLQKWHAYKIGGKGSNFWAFGDSGGVSGWNEYPATGNGPYTPSYIDETSVTTAKYMEAIREGIQDYEYLTMLQNAIAELVETGAPDTQVDPLLDLLQNAPDRVMAGEDGANWRWDEEKDRAVQDRVRIEVLEALVGLQKP
ncbi:MAG: hypothetical protein GX131_08285 [candidate division WS1 bacterium]|nr:hypothetical protein [candidate division WS1 bacterium]